MVTGVFLINLDKSVDRLRSCHAQLKAVGIDYERVSAVYGAELSRREIETYFIPLLRASELGQVGRLHRDGSSDRL